MLFSAWKGSWQTWPSHRSKCFRMDTRWNLWGAEARIRTRQVHDWCDSRIERQIENGLWTRQISTHCTVKIQMPLSCYGIVWRMGYCMPSLQKYSVLGLLPRLSQMNLHVDRSTNGLMQGVFHQISWPVCPKAFIIPCQRCFDWWTEVSWSFHKLRISQTGRVELQVGLTSRYASPKHKHTPAWKSSWAKNLCNLVASVGENRTSVQGCSEAST